MFETRSKLKCVACTAKCSYPFQPYTVPFASKNLFTLSLLPGSVSRHRCDEVGKDERGGTENHILLDSTQNNLISLGYAHCCFRPTSRHERHHYWIGGSPAIPMVPWCPRYKGHRNRGCSGIRSIRDVEAP